MATIEKRVDDLEYTVGHLPEDLDARFAGVDTKLAAIREVQALHTTRFTTLERKVDGLEHKVDGLERKIDGIASQLGDLVRRLAQS